MRMRLLAAAGLRRVLLIRPGSTRQAHVLRAYVLFEVRFRAETEATSRALPAFDLLTLSQVEFAADKLLRLCVYRLDVDFHVAGFGELSAAAWLWAFETLAVCQRRVLDIHMCQQRSVGLASLATGGARRRVYDLDVGLQFRVGWEADLRTLK